MCECHANRIQFENEKNLEKTKEKPKHACKEEKEKEASLCRIFLNFPKNTTKSSSLFSK